MPVFPGKNPVARARSDGQPEPEKEARGSANARGAIGAYPRPRRDFCRPRAGAALFDRRRGGRRTLAEQFGRISACEPVRHATRNRLQSRGVSTKRKLPPRVCTRSGSRRNFCSSFTGWSRAVCTARAAENAGLPGGNDRRDAAARRCGGLRQRQARRLAIIGAALRYSHNASLNHLLYYEELVLPQPLRGRRPAGPFPGRRQEPAE